MKLKQSIVIEQNSDLVWHMLAERFADISQWYRLVYHSQSLELEDQLQGAPAAGRVCQISKDPRGLRLVEQITRYDAAAGMLEFDVEIEQAGPLFPVKRNKARFEVVHVTQEKTRVRLLVDPVLKWHGYLIYPMLRLGLGHQFRQMLTALKQHCEQQTQVLTPSAVR